MQFLQQQQQSKIINVNMNTSFATNWFISRMLEFEATHAPYQIGLNTPGRTVNLLQENIDCAFGAGKIIGLNIIQLKPWLQQQISQFRDNR